MILGLSDLGRRFEAMNIQYSIHAPLQALFEGWCDRRAYRPLKYFLGGWPLCSGLTDDWQNLYCSLIRVRDLEADSLTSAEISALGSVIKALQELLDDRLPDDRGKGKVEEFKNDDPGIGRLKERLLVQETQKILKGLLEGWCDRRCVPALRCLSAIWPVFSEKGSRWRDLIEALKHLRGSWRDALTETELVMVEDLIIRLENELKI